MPQFENTNSSLTVSQPGIYGTPAARDGTFHPAALADSVKQSHEVYDVSPKKRRVEVSRHLAARSGAFEHQDEQRPRKRRRTSPSSDQRGEHRLQFDSASASQRKRKMGEVDECVDLHRATKCRKTASAVKRSSRKYQHHQCMPSDEFLLRCRGYFADVARPMSIQDVFDELRFFKSVGKEEDPTPDGCGKLGTLDRALYNNLIKKETNALKRVITDRVGAEEARRFLKQRDQSLRFEPWGKLLKYGHWHPLVSSQEETGAYSTVARRKRANQFGFWTAPVEEIPLKSNKETERNMGDPETEFYIDESWKLISGASPWNTNAEMNLHRGINITGSSYQYKNPTTGGNGIEATESYLGVLESSLGSEPSSFTTSLTSPTTPPNIDDSGQSSPQFPAAMNEWMDFSCNPVRYSPIWKSQSDTLFIPNEEVDGILNDQIHQEYSFQRNLRRNDDREEEQFVESSTSPLLEMNSDEFFEWPFNEWPCLTAQEVLDILYQL